MKFRNHPGTHRTSVEVVCRLHEAQSAPELTLRTQVRGEDPHRHERQRRVAAGDAGVAGPGDPGTKAAKPKAEPEAKATKPKAEPKPRLGAPRKPKAAPKAEPGDGLVRP